MNPTATGLNALPPFSKRTGRLRTGVFALLTIIWTLLTMLVLGPYKFEHNFQDQIDSPVLALELASNASDLRTVLRSENPMETEFARQLLRTNNRLDLILIPLYTGFLWSFVTMLGTTATTSMLRRACYACIFGTGVFDYVEDVGISRALDRVQLTDQMARAISLPSVLKWGLLGAALFLIALLLFRSDGMVYSRATTRLMAILHALAGLFIVVGILQHSKIELGFRIFGLLVVWNAAALLGPLLTRRFPGMVPVYVTDFCTRSRVDHEPSVAAQPLALNPKDEDRTR